MTDREIIAELKKEVVKQGYTLKEYNIGDKFDRDAKSNYRVLWQKDFIQRIEFKDVHKNVPAMITKINKISELKIEESSFDLDWISTIEISRLTLFYTSYNSLPASFAKLKSLMYLSLIDSGLDHLPPVIQNMSNLITILIIHDADMPQNKKMPCFYLPKWLSKMPSLEVLDLSMSRIHSIPSDLLKTKMPFITDPDSEEDGINISEIELVEGDIALFSQPRDVIEAFYFGNQNTAQECKVIFLGEGKSGKSSLIERMINDTFESGKLPTEGIRMQTWPVEIDEETIRLRILDFGGQEIMHAMHRCFMTQHTVYVLVCEIRQDGDIDREAARWLENIDTFAKGCPVILALNKADENKNASVNEKNLKIVNPALRQTIKTSAAWEQKEGTTPLLEAIKDAVKDAMDKSEGNAGILSLRQDLENMEQNYITDKEYRTLCAKHGVDNRAVQSGLLNWFKDLGICYNFKSEALNTRLESFQVLNPAWLTNGIYRLILRTPENGMLSHATIKETLEATDPNDVLPDITYEPDETDFILHVMREFKISHIMSGGRELIPLKMTKTPPAAADDFDLKTALHLSWKANYLPNTVVHRLMICKFNELDLACLWRSGACFISLDKKQSAYVNMSDTCIDVYVQGIDKRMYMEAFRKEIISIMFDLDLKPEEMVHFFWEGEERALPYIDIVEQFRRGKTGVFVRGAEKEPNPRDILQEHYVNEKERVNMAGVNITINGDYNKVATDKARIEEQYVSNTKETHINTTTHTQEIIRDNILRRNEITQEDFETLVAHLKQISGHENTPPALAPKLNEIVEQCEDRTSKSTWYKLREFLGDAANIAALMSLTMAPEFSQMLSMIFR